MRKIRAKYRVPLESVDGFVQRERLDRADYIKADLEGADYEMLLGAKHTLARFHPRVAVCTYHSRNHFRLMREFLETLGYSNIRGRGLVAGCGDPHPSAIRPMILHASWI